MVSQVFPNTFEIMDWRRGGRASGREVHLGRGSGKRGEPGKSGPSPDRDPSSNGTCRRCYRPETRRRLGSGPGSPFLLPYHHQRPSNPTSPKRYLCPSNPPPSHGPRLPSTTTTGTSNPPRPSNYDYLSRSDGLPYYLPRPPPPPPPYGFPFGFPRNGRCGPTGDGP